MVVDGDMNVFPACSPGLSAFLSAPATLFCTLAGDAMAYLVETTEFFDIDVDHLTGFAAFIAVHRLSGFQVALAVEAMAGKDPSDG